MKRNDRNIVGAITWISISWVEMCWWPGTTVLYQISYRGPAEDVLKLKDWGKYCTRLIEQSFFFPLLTDILLNDEVILGPTFYLAEYILQVVRYADPGTATKFARFQNPHVPHPVQLVLRVDFFQFRQYRTRHVHVFLIRTIMQ